MLLWVHPLMKLFVLIVSPSVSFLFEITISIEEQVLVTLEYWQECRTYFQIGTSGQLSESTIGRIVNKKEKML